MFNSFRIKLISSLTLLLISISPQVMAHKVNLFAYVEGNEVFVEGYFVDGKKAQNSKVTVSTTSGEVLLEGVTDDQGQYRFAVPKKTDLKIVLNAGMGHQGHFVLSADELGRATANQIPANESNNTLRMTTSVEAVEVKHGQDTQAQTELEQIVSKAVNEAIKPLVRELSASQEKASLTGILGGVGYIFGMLGLFAYFKSRENQKNSSN